MKLPDQVLTLMKGILPSRAKVLKGNVSDPERLALNPLEPEPLEVSAFCPEPSAATPLGPESLKVDLPVLRPSMVNLPGIGPLMVNALVNGPSVVHYLGAEPSVIVSFGPGPLRVIPLSSVYSFSKSASLVTSSMYSDSLWPTEEEPAPEKYPDYILWNCTGKGYQQVMDAIEAGTIPFAKTDEGKEFLMLLLNACPNRIRSFRYPEEYPIINDKVARSGGLPALVWRLWRIAENFPDRVGNIAQSLPSYVFEPGMAFKSLGPAVKEAITELERLEVKKGKPIKHMVPEHRTAFAEAAKNRGHNPLAVKGLIGAQYGEGLQLDDFILHDAPSNEEPGRPETIVPSLKELPDTGKGGDWIIFRSVSTQAKCPYCGAISTKRARGGPRSEKTPRVFADTPIQCGVPCYVAIYGIKKYVCTNPACEHDTFSESFPCCMPGKRYSKRLSGMIIAMAALTSFHGESELWKLCGVSISDNTIRAMLMGLVFDDDPDIDMIGIDDVAKRKGQSYYTIIYAVKDHRLLAIVDGRDGSELIKWLEKHKKVRLICRDRASAYSNAIDTWATENHCTVTEIADRFHLIQNMIEQMKKHYLSSLPLRFAIIVDANGARIVEGDDIPHKKAQAVAPKPTPEQFEVWDDDNQPPVDETGTPFEFEVPKPGGAKKGKKKPKDTAGSCSQDTAQEEKKEECVTASYPCPIDEAEQEERIKLYELICTIRNELDPKKPKKQQYRNLADSHHITAKEAGSYCRMTPDEVESILDGIDQAQKDSVKASLRSKAEALAEMDEKSRVATTVSYSKRPPEWLAAFTDETPVLPVSEVSEEASRPRARKIDGYKYIIYKMLRKGRSVSDVFWYVKEKGCTLTDKGLIENIIAIYEIAYPGKRSPNVSRYLDLKYEEGVHVIRRCELMKYFVTVNPKTARNSIIADHEALILAKYASVRNIRSIFMEFHSAIMGTDETAIDQFIHKHKNGELEGFCKSLSNDIEAVKNAVRYAYSSGFVEGNNSKFKTLKRICGGRLKLDTLIQKCMLGFWYTRDGFQLGDVVPWLDSESTGS